MAREPGGAGETPFAVLLRRRRRALGLTQPALAGRARMSVRGLQHLEAGDARPTRATLRALADALDLTAEDRALWEATVQPPGAAGPARRRRQSRRAPSRLPAPLTSFVGRHSEVAALRARLLARP